MDQANDVDVEAEFQATQDRFINALKESRNFVPHSISKIDEEFGPIQQEFTWMSKIYYDLEKRKEKIKTDLRNLQAGTIDSATVPYGQAACQRLIHKFEKSGCSREIRDKVYDYYWRGWKRADTASAMNVLIERWKVNCPAPNGPCRCLKPRKFHHTRPVILDPDYVGFGIAREALEFWYYAEAPKIFHGTMNLSRCLNFDMLHLGVTPAMSLHRLDIQISLIALKSVMQCSYKQAPQYHRGSLVDNLAALEGIHKKHGFKLNIELQFFERPTESAFVESVLDHIAPTFYHFQAEGAQIQVSFRWNAGGYESRAFRFKMNEYFSIDRDLWKERLKNDIEMRCGCSSSYRRFFEDELDVSD